MLVSLAAPAAGYARSTPAQSTHGPDPVTAAAPSPVAAVAAAGDWCGNDGAGPGANQVDNGEYRYHAIYAYPADSGSRLSTFGAQFQEDAYGASDVIERQYGRAIRFDVGTPCGPGNLDVSEVRLPFTQDQLAALGAAGGAATFNAVTRALQAQGFPVASNDADPATLAPLRENFLVWLDGAGPTRSCGQGTALIDPTRSDTNLNNLGGKLALIYRQGRGFCGADVVRHEIGHNLGALQPDAPHSDDGVHCNDAFEDTMCGWDSPKVSSGPFNGIYFDYGNDDYWDPPQGAPLGWWTLNLSRFICPDARCNRPAQARDRTADAARNARVPVLKDRAGRATRRHRAKQRWSARLPASGKPHRRQAKRKPAAAGRFGKRP